MCMCVILISQWLNEDERALLVLTPLAVFGHQDSNPTNLTPLTKGTKKKKKNDILKLFGNKYQL